MLARVPASASAAISASAMVCQQRQDSAEPLWFALLCRELWGANAPKELEYALTRIGHQRSDRTCRAWAAGDSPPPVNILLMLQRDPEWGERVLGYVMRECEASWWLEFVRNAELGRQVRALIE